MTHRDPRRLSEHPVPDSHVPRLTLTEWSSLGLVAGITTRRGEFDLGLTAPAPTASTERWRRLVRTFSGSFRSVVVSRQVHGTELHHVRAGTDGLVILDGKDGHVTTEAGVLLAVTVADCVPVYLAEPSSGAVALLHAGWRGVAAGILERGVRALIAAAKARERDVVMHCGVAICGDCYEVGPEVAAAITGERRAGPSRLDLRAVLAQRARKVGVRGVTLSPHCTAHQRETFFSHRASGGADGRMVAFLGRPMS